MNIRTISLLIVVLALSLINASGQTEKFVKQIRNDVSKINKSVSKYKKTTKEIEGISLEGTEAIYYSSRTGLHKIHAELFGETYRASADFYYKSGKLIFAFYQFNRYDTHISADPPPKVVKTEDKRLYFANGKMIKKITTITETALNDKSEDAEKDILDLERAFRIAMNK